MFLESLELHFLFLEMVLECNGEDSSWTHVAASHCIYYGSRREFETVIIVTTFYLHRFYLLHFQRVVSLASKGGRCSSLPKFKDVRHCLAVTLSHNGEKGLAVYVMCLKYVVIVLFGIIRQIVTSVSHTGPSLCGYSNKCRY